jgi:hypothetical protein
MGADLGYFSILRWRHDATRDEARNVAVILVEPEGQFGALKAAPISAISPKLREQGLLDAMVNGLSLRLSGLHGQRPNLADLRQMQINSRLSLYLTEPQMVAVPDVDLAMSALYKAYVAPRSAGPSYPTKGKILDAVVERLRRSGAQVRRGEYVQDFLFDMVIGEGDSQVAEVVSFAAPNKTWANVEYQMGHFLYGIEHVGSQGVAVVQPPGENSHDSAWQSHDRVIRWCEKAKVAVLEPNAATELLMLR